MKQIILAILISVFFGKLRCLEVSNCDDPNSMILCETSALINNTLTYVLRRMDSRKNIEIMPGIDLVQGKANENQMRSGGNTVLSKVVDYLNTHYLKIDFSNFLQKEQLRKMLKTLEQSRLSQSGN
jgi:hypothetical protein